MSRWGRFSQSFFFPTSICKFTVTPTPWSNKKIILFPNNIGSEAASRRSYQGITYFVCVTAATHRQRLTDCSSLHFLPRSLHLAGPFLQTSSSPGSSFFFSSKNGRFTRQVHLFVPACGPSSKRETFFKAYSVARFVTTRRVKSNQKRNICTWLGFFHHVARPCYTALARI